MEALNSKIQTIQKRAYVLGTWNPLKQPFTFTVKDINLPGYPLNTRMNQKYIFRF
jgi:hypothetical protein